MIAFIPVLFNNAISKESNYTIILISYLMESLVFFKWYSLVESLSRIAMRLRDIKNLSKW